MDKLVLKIQILISKGQSPKDCGGRRVVGAEFGYRDRDRWVASVQQREGGPWRRIV